MISKKRLANKAKMLLPMVRIGKDGLTDNIVSEIKRQLKEKKLVKIKLLQSAEGRDDKKKFADKVAERTGAELVQQVGFVVVLYRRQVL